MRALTEVKKEAIRLRIDERLSISEIQRRTGASRGSLSVWLRAFPLHPAEIRERQQQAARKTAQQTLNKRYQHTPAESKYHRMVGGRSISRHDKMKISEAAILLRLALHGFSVYNSVFDGEKTDWVAIDNVTNDMLKIEVRCVKRHRYGWPTVSLHCSNGRAKYRRMSQSEFDVLVGYDLFSDTAYVFRSEELDHLKDSVSVNADSAERWDKLRPCGPAATTPG